MDTTTATPTTTPTKLTREQALDKYGDVKCYISEFDKHREAAQRALDVGVSFTTAGGIKVIAFQENQDETSDAAELDAGAHDVVVGFSYAKEPGADHPRLRFSLRSHTGFDVGAFAKALGGGGHAAAAGFEVGTFERSHTPYQEIREALCNYEIAALAGQRS